MTTRLTFKPRLRIKVLFPRLVGFAEDAISGPGSLTLLSALISETGGVTVGEAAATIAGETEVAVGGVGRTSFAAGGAAVAVDAEPRDAFSPDEAVGDIVGDSVTADDGGTVAVFAVCPAVPVTGGVRDSFVAVAVRDADTVGGGDTTEGTGSVIARF
jgi:hypothetical protein